jgi:hypothetical protein
MGNQAVSRGIESAEGALRSAQGLDELCSRRVQRQLGLHCLSACLIRRDLGISELHGIADAGGVATGPIAPSLRPGHGGGLAGLHGRR